MANTKTHPGPFACFEAALPDEPMFILLARDPAAPATLQFWAQERIKHGKTHEEDDQRKIAAALDESIEMETWRDQMIAAAEEADMPVAWRLPRPDFYDAGGPVYATPIEVIGEMRKQDRDLMVQEAVMAAAHPPTVDSAPSDLAHNPEVPGHRFATFHKAGRYAYARGLEVNPTHLPAALDAMAGDGWFLVSIFGQTDSQHVGFIFERREPGDTVFRIDGSGLAI